METGLSLIWCPKCKMARVIELRVKRENENLGQVFIKCPRSVDALIAITLCFSKSDFGLFDLLLYV